MAALRPGFAKRAGRTRPDPRHDLQAGRHAGGLGRAGRLAAQTQVICVQAWTTVPLSTNAVCDASQRVSQRYIHGIGMMKAQATTVTIARHRNSSPVPLKTTSRRVPSI